MPVGIRRAALALTLVLTGSFGFGATAPAAPECRQQVIEDWSDNGRVDRLYALACYEQAVTSLPPEVRDYTDAYDVIDRALTLAVRKQGGSRAAAQPARQLAAKPSDASGSTAVPTSLFVLGAIALGTLATGALAYAGRRARSRRRGAAG